ncbi:Xanthine and CO dehydrogenases maturation factor [Janthinobacterium sp. Marseille]|nr:XdhC family protein [Janthinobacterium sp. Marseille]ABR89953.1 Xanthine and CO dehydrogenases maturation factor [Janthinobacterium sp. Marseille]
MENLDLIVLRTLRDWRLQGKNAVLATVTRTWGASPRPPGSLMALCETGSVVGSVSGGCIEDDLIRRFATWETFVTAEGKARRPQWDCYGLSADEAHRFGLPCGGTLELLLEFNPDAALLAQLVRQLEGGVLVQRQVDLASGRVVLSPADRPSALSVTKHDMKAVFGPGYRMLLIGAGQLTEYLATMAVFSGFAVTVCDPREEYRRAWSVPNVQFIEGMPDDAVLAMKLDQRSCVVALTHDPKLDDLALIEALASPAFYVGAIGSRRNNTARRSRLSEHFALSDESLAKLHGPVGIYIGSKTPSEIAISIMAEVVAAKNGVQRADLDVASNKQKDDFRMKADALMHFS